jgi:hypothetical protein
VSDLIFNRRLKPMESASILSPNDSLNSEIAEGNGVRDVSSWKNEGSFKMINHEEKLKEKNKGIELQERMENALIEQSKYIDKMRNDLDEDNESIENDDEDEKESTDDSDNDEALEKKAAFKASTRGRIESGENSSRLESLIRTEAHNESLLTIMKLNKLENFSSVNDDGELEDDNVSELEIDFENGSPRGRDSGKEYQIDKGNKIRYISIFENENKSMFPPFAWNAKTSFGSKDFAHFTDERGKGGNMGKYIYIYVYIYVYIFYMYVCCFRHIDRYIHEA